MRMQWILLIQRSDIICQHYHYTVWWLAVRKRQGDDLCQHTAVPFYRYLVGSGDSVTVHGEGGYSHSTTPSPALLSRDRGRPSPPMADTHHSPSLLSWRYSRCYVSRFYSHYLPSTLDSTSKHCDDGWCIEYIQDFWRNMAGIEFSQAIHSWIQILNYEIHMISPW